MSAPSLGDELVAQGQHLVQTGRASQIGDRKLEHIVLVPAGLLDDLFPFLKPPSLHSRRTRCTVAELLKSLMGEPTVQQTIGCC